MNPDHTISIGGDVSGSVLATGSHNLVIQAQQVMFQAAQKAAEQGRDAAHMLRVLTLLAAPVLDPENHKNLPEPLDLRREWENLAQAVRESHAPILLARLTPPTLEALHAALSPRAELQQAFPHVLHFSGHAWSGGLLLEDELGQVHRVTTAELVNALKDIPRPPDLVVLNGCETAAVESVAGALLERGLARAVVGHPQPVLDEQAVKFAARLYAELTNGFPLRTALENAAQTVTTHPVTLLGDGDLCLKEYLQPGTPLMDDRRPPGNLPSRRDFFGRGRDLVTIARALERRPRVVALSGPPGIGKSALLLEVAHRNAWRFPGGVTFAEGPHPEAGRSGTAAELLAALAGGLGMTVPSDRVEQALLKHTRDQPTLLLLDNIESLPEPEMDALRRFLERLGGESAALIASRPPLPALRELPSAAPYDLHHGLEESAALRYLSLLAGHRSIPLKPELAAELVHATDGHPQLLELLVVRAGERDLGELLKEVGDRRGDFQAQLERVYDWCAERAGEEGCRAWALLPLFPAGRAPERPLRALAGEEGLRALREAALADFDPRQQAWTWHATVSEYARARRPLKEKERLALLKRAMPAWAEWLRGLAEDEAAARLEVQARNLEPLLAAAPRLGRKAAWDFLERLDARLPEPDRTLTLRGVQPPLYQAMLALATDAAEKARAQLMLGNALSALGQQEQALAATQEAVQLYRPLAQQNPQAFLPDLALSLNNLGAMLSDLGRREEALAATQEAVGIYRPLAQAQPGAFLSDLARSLGAHGMVLLGLGRPAEARQAFGEGLQALLPLLRAYPQAFGGLAGALVEGYLRACEQAGQPPDAALAQQVKQALG